MNSSNRNSTVVRPSAATCTLASLAVVALGYCAPSQAQVNGQAAHWGTQGRSCAAAPADEAKPWLNPAYSAVCRARYALDAFKTVEEKLNYIAPPRGSFSFTFQPPGDKPKGCQFAPRVDPVFTPPPLLVKPPDQPPAAAPRPAGPPPSASPPASPAPQPVVRDMNKVLALPETGGGTDGPAGVRGADCVTAFNTPLSVAATFDPQMAAKYGDLIGQDFHDAGYNFQLGPAMDLTRTWRFGRSTESFGEDPFLTAMIVGPEVRAIGANHVVSQMKHYAVYTQEQGRVGDQPSGQQPAGNNEVSERALREIYLPGFAAAVRVGRAGRVMCSFPRVNGIYACENTHLFDILKNDFGFQGTVGPDFPSAQRSIVPAIIAGLDSGTFVPNNGTFKGQIGLAEGVAQGIVPEARLDDIILRTLIPQFQGGVFEYPAKRTAADVSTPQRRAQVVDIITAGSVLLKNAGDVLPLGPKVRSIAVIGAQATERAQVVEQGSAIVNVQHLQPVLPAIRARAGRRVKVSFAQGTYGLEPLSAVPPAWFSTADGKPGVRAEYFANADLDFTGRPLAVATQPTPDLAGVPPGLGLPALQQWSVRYTTRFTPRKSGTQKFSVYACGTLRLYIDDRLIGTIERSDFGDAVFANVPGTAGQPLDIRIEYTPRAALRPTPNNMFGAFGGTQIRFGYAPPDDMIADAARAAARADVALVFVGHKVGEGMDRTSLALPNDQDALIEAVAQANPHTVVVLNTGGGVTMPWLDKVAAVLEMWLPGDAYGPAAAKLLFGDADPGGRLPVTFPADESQGPATRPFEYPGTQDSAGRLDTAWFDEGIFIGYRWWDAHDQQPLFPFGYGLSYARFAIDGPALVRTPDGGARITVNVLNTGKRSGTQVLQAYVSFPPGAGEPPRQLKGVAKLSLDPGHKGKAEIMLAPSAFRYWDGAGNGWRQATGNYTVALGLSSRDIIWQESFRPGG